MNIEELVKDTFTAHQDLIPDEHAVMSAVRERTAPHSRAAAMRRPLATVTSIAAVAAVAAGAVLLAENHDDAPAHRLPAAHSGSAPAKHKHGSATKKSIAPLTMPYDLGWLPAGVKPFVQRINTGATSDKPMFDGEYMLSGAGLYIDVQQMPGSLGGEIFKSGSGRQVTINGRPGVESTNAGNQAGYEVYFQDSAGGVMYVNVSHQNGGTGPADKYRTIGRHIARKISLPGQTTVQPSFGVGRVPAGMHVRAFEVEKMTKDGTASPDGSVTTTSYDIGNSTDLNAPITVGAGKLGQPVGGTSGRTVQGHVTRYTVERGFVTLSVLKADHGMAIVIQAKGSLSEAYKIADGLILSH